MLVENADERDIGDLAIRYRNAVLSVRKKLSLKGVNLDASIGSRSPPATAACSKS